MENETPFYTSTWNSLYTLRRRRDNFLVKKLLLQEGIAPASWCQLGSSRMWMEPLLDHNSGPALPLACSRLIVRAVLLGEDIKHKPPQAEGGTESLFQDNIKTLEPSNAWVFWDRALAPLLQAVCFCLAWLNSPCSSTAPQGMYS